MAENLEKVAQKKQASDLNKKMGVQKRAVTREVGKVTGLIHEFKTKKLAKSALARQSAEAALQSWESAKDKVAQLEFMIDKHNELIFLACTID